jgi:hypothetical protein
VHIGPTKTGSKFLQSILFHSRKSLLVQGICYPDNWWTAPDQIMHERLLHLLRGRCEANVKDSFKQLNAAGHRVVVLSCEGFDALEPDRLQLLRDAIGKNPIEIVYYCRRWSDRIPSDWKQEIKMGACPTLPQFYASYLRNPIDTDAVNYSRVWEKFSRIFGRKSLRLVSYSNLRDRGVDLYSHFVTTFLGLNGCDPSIEKDLIQSNISPDLCDTEILRALNWLDFRAVGRVRLNMRVKFLLLRQTWDTRALAEMMADEIRMLEIRDDSETFRRSWEGMCKYADRLVGKEFGSVFFDRRSTNVPYVSANYLLKDRAVRELYALYEKIARTELNHPEIEKGGGAADVTDRHRAAGLHMQPLVVDEPNMA